METSRRRSKKELDAPALRNLSLLERLRAERFLSSIIALSILSVWELGVRSGNISALYFPAPSFIVQTLIRLSINDILIPHLFATLSRLLLGFVLGGLSGLILGLIMGWSSRLRTILEPFIAAAHPVPKIAIWPLILIIFGLGETSKVIVIAIAAFFPMLISAISGVKQISAIHFEVAQSYGAGLIKTFTRIIIPGSLPLVLTGARLSLNTAMIITITVELVSAQKGLGAMLWLARETFRTEELYCGLIVISALGISFNFLLQYLTKRFVTWQI